MFARQFCRFFTRLAFLTAPLLARPASVPAPGGPPGVIINEIMYHPCGGRASDEWIELHNVSPNLINLGGWRFTRGIDFTFPGVSIPSQGYLVVAADLAAFRAKYPAVTNVVGGWSGQLSNSDETVRLAAASGASVNSVHYFSEGEWAQRERGNGATPVTSITCSGSTATVTAFDHGCTPGDQVVISGADQPEYNCWFTVNRATPTTFEISVSGSPDSPATGAIVCRQIQDDGYSGWSWFCAADGLGSSLELVNPSMPNAWGQNWQPSTEFEGTPGRANSVLKTNTAPLLLNVAHTPPVPRSADSVSITARVRDERPNGVQAVNLFYRDHTGNTPPSFSSAAMLDDGQHGDGASGDGLYGAVLPPSTNGTVIEFYVQATDTAGLTRTWPAPAWQTSGAFGQFANALFQVDDEVITNQMPSIRLVLTGTERAVFPPRNRNSDAEMNATMIGMDSQGVEVRYNCGVRVRGAGSRMATPPNNRLNIPNDRPWRGLSAVNLNGQFIHAQLMGSAVAQLSGLPAADARVIQYRINGVNPAPTGSSTRGGFGGGFGGRGAGYGSFVLVEPVNGDFANDIFPQDGGGNVYRASSQPHAADLTYQGTNAAGYFARGYAKASNKSENDWTDLMNLAFAFSRVESDSDYVRAVRANANVELWMRYFAVGTLINYGETSLFNGRGDDYALYRGKKDPRFVLIGHDFDTIFGQGDTTTTYPTQTNSSIYIMLNPPHTGGRGPFGGNAPNVPVLRRFLTHAEFAPLFFSELKRLADTVFHPDRLNPLMDQLLTDWGPGPSSATIEAMKTHATHRRAAVLSQIPLTLTVSNSLVSSNGFLFSPKPEATLFGASHAIDTRKVLVNGLPANWAPWDGKWTNTVMLQPGVNRVLVQSVNSNEVEFARATLHVWYDDGSMGDVFGAITTNTTWSAAEGPYRVTENLTVAEGATLRIQAGTTVYLEPGVRLTVASGGRLLAEATDTAWIHFMRAPGSSGNWANIALRGGSNSPETRIAYAHIDGNGSTAIQAADVTVFLDHLTFGNTSRPYLSIDRSSFVVQDCVFPSATGRFELIHADGGIKSGGRGIFLRNFFGAPRAGYTDVIDFTGCNRPGPIVEFINNVFVGATDDILDFDGTDAWIEGNIFLHAHRNGSPNSSSAVSGGSNFGNTSQFTVIGNLFYDVDQAATAKQGNFYTLINNTIVHQTRVGGMDSDAAVFNFSDPGAAEGAGLYLEGNIIYDAEKLTRNLRSANVTFTNNLMPFEWTGPGGNNLKADPMFQHLPQLSETTNFTSWSEAQVMRDWLKLRTGSPARATGPNGRDEGGVIPIGVSISGEPVGVTPSANAVLHVGLNRAGDGIPTSSAAFPNGSGYTHYKWRLDGGSWNEETAITNPITLSELSSGPHYVEAVGKRDSGTYQNDPAYGRDAVVTRSRTWIVKPGASPLRLNEILASNGGALNHHGTTPDAVELFNSSQAELDLSGMGLTDDPSKPAKFAFPSGTVLAAQAYLLVFANNPDRTPGHHLGFGLNQDGDAVYLFDSKTKGGALIDSVTFGPQLTDFSIGRLADGTWSLTRPTFGVPNQAAPVGDPAKLRINEWLASPDSSAGAKDFVELHNSDTFPVGLGGFFLSDEIIGWPDRHQIAPLSFIPGNGFLRFWADGDTKKGPSHLKFGLSAEQGAIGLCQPDLTPIDLIVYQPQRQKTSQGRSPDGGSQIVFFDQATPGKSNRR
ncbi:MAG: lamin tail domain-containing protein [Verrucomicrobia bacterium]|nr:lamin tail domain-containing protein [Verrucomicrobiota bacterium]